MEQEFKLSVYEVMQDPTPSGRTSEDGSPAGDTIRKLILDNWDKHEKVSIYFDGIMKMTRPFCDEAFGKILENELLKSLMIGYIFQTLMIVFLNSLTVHSKSG